MMKRFDPRGAEFLRMGRFSKDEQTCELWWSGSGIRMLLDCTRLEIEAEVADGEHSPWLAVTVDGAFHDYRFAVGSRRSWRGRINHFRFDPAQMDGLRVTIESIRLVPHERAP